jgi:hypothetical protein
MRTPAPRHEPLGSGPFAKTNASFTGVEDFDWDALGASVTERDVRERGRRSFVLRALDEQRSLRAFSELLAELCQAGAPVDVIGSLTRVVRDEALHVDLCDRVVKKLGGWDAAAPEPQWVKSDPRLPLPRRILSTVLGSLCVGETVSVHMIKAVRENATDPVAHAVLTQILADESFHSRFGWWWLESMPLDDADRAWAQRYLERLLPGLSKQLAPMRARKVHVASPFGSASGEAREAAFRAAIHQTILPGFDRAGLDASGLWKHLEARQAA